MATFPHDYKSPLSKVVIQIEDKWYDCTAWRLSHPGGAELIDKFHNADATEAFFSLHSKEAIAKLQKMTAKPVASDDKRDQVSINFAKFREKLAREGWLDRNWAEDFFYYMLPCLFFVFLGIWCSHSSPIFAVFCLGLGMQQGGWLGHDYVHGRGKLSRAIGCFFGPVMNGFSANWWSNKHNTHHTFPNRKEVDSDIHNEPIIHLWFPDPSKEVWYRQYQKYYFPFAYSLLYVSWRFQSILFVLGSRDWADRTLLALSVIWVALLPWKVAISAMLLGGFFVAIIVTANHQTEDIIETDAKYNFVVDQFKTTRGVQCYDPITEYFFGGMQYQLEHHLFPTMPKARFAKLRPLLKQFAAENGLQHHISSPLEILKLNYEVLSKNSEPAPKKSN